MKPEEQFFPQYEICKNEEGKPILLGRGGFSTVYEVRRRETAGRHYALKVIGSDQKIVRPELFRETVRLQRLLGEQCPYIVRILDTAETTDAENGGRPVQGILMEKLSPVLDKDRFGKVSLTVSGLMEEPEVLTFAMQIGQAIYLAHAGNILHRDVKLENIFRDEETGQYKLGDFGLAKYVEDGKAETVAYTDGYGAPEISRRLYDNYGATADIYSFGITLYLLLNDLCFPGSSGYYSSEVQYQPDYILPAPRNASEPMAAVLRKMCSYRSTERYQSMAEVLAAFQWVKDMSETAAGEAAPEEELPELATATYYSSDGEHAKDGEAQPDTGEAGHRRSRKEILQIERDNRSYRREQSLWCMGKLTLLLLTVMTALEGSSGKAMDWRLWILPVAVGIEAVLQKMREMDLLFGILAAAACIYSGVTGGFTTIHILLPLFMLSGIAELTGAAALAAGLWLLWAVSGRCGWLLFSYDWQLAWIPAVAAVSVAVNYIFLKNWIEEPDRPRGDLWCAVMLWLGPVSVAGGILTGLLKHFAGIQIPDFLERLHPLLSGILLTGCMTFHFYWNRELYDDVYMDEGRDREDIDTAG